MSTAALTWEQFRFERKLFWRNPTAAFFNFVLPLLLLLLVATAFASEGDELDVLIPGVAGMSVMATTFTALAYVLVYRREEGILKRVRGTPMPAISYLGGMIGSAVLNAVLQVLLVVVIGHVLYGVDWPADWLLLAGFSMLGVICFGSLGSGVRARDPERGLGPGVGQRGVPAADLHLRRLLLVRLASRRAEGGGRGAAAQAPGRRPVGRHRGRGRGHAVAAAVVGGWTVAGLLLAVRYFRWS